MKRLIIATLLTSVLFTTGQFVRAADEVPAVSETPKVTNRAKQMPFYGTVKAVDEEKKTFTLVGKEKDRVFKVTESTRIHKSGEPMKLVDIKIGQRVGGLAKAAVDGEWEVATLNLGVKQGKDAEDAAPTE
jgi:hypothetical protein